MITAKNFRIDTLQFSIFTPLLLFQQNQIFADIMRDFGGILDGNPIALPLPEDAPKELPRLICQSKDTAVKLEIAISRANLFIYSREKREVVNEGFFIDLLSKLFTSYIKMTSAKIGRLAVVAVKVLPVENPGLFLAKHFCKEQWIVEPFNRPENFEIHSHKKYHFSDFDVNSWVRCKCGILKNNRSPIILVEQDINTYAEEIEKNSFSPEQMIRFAEESLREQSEILAKYFPQNV